MTAKHKTWLALMLVAVASLALVGGALWIFADKEDTPAPPRDEFRMIVDAAENWDTEDLLLAVDDTVTRTAEVRNEGSNTVRLLLLKADVTATQPLDSSVRLPQVVTLTVKHEGKTLLKTKSLAQLNQEPLKLPAGGIKPGEKAELDFSYRLDTPAYSETTGPRGDFASNPANRFQGGGLAVRYTALASN